MARARKPIASDSPSAITPRTTGSRNTGCRAIAESMGRATCAISPDGLRTATAQLPGPRIITPSRTACPDVGHAGSSALAAARLTGALQATLEALDATTRVHELLLAGVERMALRADLDVQLGLRRAGLERVSARARHGGEDVLGMDAGFHCPLKIAAACLGSTLPPETTTATPGPASTLPARTAPAAAAPAGSHASLARS